MAHRDFAGRSGSKNNKKKAKKSFNRNTLIGLALVVVLGFGLGLYFLKNKTPAPVVTTNVQPEKPQPKSVLPNRPEEVWHYIKELETRTVPVDNNLHVSNPDASNINAILSPAYGTLPPAPLSHLV